VGEAGGDDRIPLINNQTRKIKHVDFGKFGEVRVGGVKHEWVEGD